MSQHFGESQSIEYHLVELPHAYPDGRHLARPQRRRARVSYQAWGHKLLGDVASLEQRMEEAYREYQTALNMLARKSVPDGRNTW